jgi:hypothetical protein
MCRLAREYCGQKGRVIGGGNALFIRTESARPHENRYRQRKALTPAFTNAAIRNLTSVFYDSAYKVCYRAARCQKLAKH